MDFSFLDQYYSSQRNTPCEGFKQDCHVLLQNVFEDEHSYHICGCSVILHFFGNFW